MQPNLHNCTPDQTEKKIEVGKECQLGSSAVKKVRKVQMDGQMTTYIFEAIFKLHENVSEQNIIFVHLPEMKYLENYKTISIYSESSSKAKGHFGCDNPFQPYIAHGLPTRKI